MKRQKSKKQGGKTTYIYTEHSHLRRKRFDVENIIRPLCDDNFKVVIFRPPMIYGEDAKGAKGYIVTHKEHILSEPARKLPDFSRNFRSLILLQNIEDVPV